MGNESDDVGRVGRRTVSVGIFAHNEERLIESVARAFLYQACHQVEIADVVVVSSGSTDRTVEFARAAGSNGRLEVVAQPQREGKIRAINSFLPQASGEFLVIASGDTVPDAELVEALCEPLISDETCGMTGCRIRQVRSTAGRVGEVSQLLWELHHRAAQRSPKLGEVVAVRRSIIGELPDVAHCDEVVLEAMTVQAGYRLEYVEGAGATNLGVTRASDLFRQRRRIHCQHLWARARLGYAPSTVRLHRLAGVVLRQAMAAPRQVPSLVMLGGIEVAARALASVDFRLGREYRTWPTTSPAGDLALLRGDGPVGAHEAERV